MLKLIWPFLVATGILFVLYIDVGRGLDSPGFWLIPIGVIGGIITLIKKRRTPGTRRLSKTLSLLLISVWLLAFFSLGGLYFGWLTEGLGALIYVWPSILFTLTGLTFLTVLMIRR